ncbi:hypothetical protein DIPPA_19950 [Diplonema papillatum]|nr:hypothetical protein DIPPA_19950 [Diplonema papillatum]
MGRRFPLFKPLAACRPLGLAIGCLIAFGVVAIGTVGIFSFTPSDVLQGFNDAVQTWKSPGMPMFVGEQFRVCNATGFCTALRPGVFG